jgi:AcrR family transcriptional regulator
MARRSEHSPEELKALVLDAAETIVIDEGFSELKVRRIAMEIGYTVGSIYMVFANMADLIMHINARTLDALTAQLEQIQDHDVEQSIESLAKAYLRYASENYNRWHNVFDYGVSTNTKIPDWYKEKVDIVFAPVKSKFAALFPDLTEDYRNSAAMALLGGIHGICVLSLTNELSKDSIDGIEKAVLLLVRNFIRGLANSSK